MSISKKVIENFTNYINSFHGIKGIYSSGRDVTNEEVSKVIKTLSEDESIEFFGDTFDRERARDILFTEEELKKMYQ